MGFKTYSKYNSYDVNPWKEEQICNYYYNKKLFYKEIRIWIFWKALLEIERKWGKVV